jgi:hypothetical protein
MGSLLDAQGIVGAQHEHLCVADNLHTSADKASVSSASLHFFSSSHF